MPALASTGPNAEQIQYWNDRAGRSWVAQQALIDRQIEPLGLRTMERAALAAGERVLDVGCGCGQTTLEIARRVGPTGMVTGVDISSAMLERARTLARERDVRNVEFLEADAQIHPFSSAAFDVIFSRFGVMFFADPTAAFANLARSLRPEGRLAFVCWRPMPENPWVTVPLAAALQYVTPPAPPGLDEPGPFSFGNAERVRGILVGAGFAEPRFDRLDEVLGVGGGEDLDRTVEFLFQIGPLGRLLAEASPEKIREVATAVRDALVPFHTSAGVRMASAAWIVVARRG